MCIEFIEFMDAMADNGEKEGEREMWKIKYLKNQKSFFRRNKKQFLQLASIYCLSDMEKTADIPS